MKIGFDPNKYKAKQQGEINTRLERNGYDRLYVEVGGKLIGDTNAARVLPGYDPDLKLEVINETFPDAEFVCVINGGDIIMGRKRGDSGSTYGSEVFRLIETLKKLGQATSKVIITRNDPDNESTDIIKFEEEVKNIGLEAFRLYENGCYKPDKSILPGLDAESYIPFTAKRIIVTSPGAGSGKFGFCLSQLYHEMKQGHTPHYMKFETFPVHDMPPKHLLNLAYTAVTADLGDKIQQDEGAGNATSYNRDLENFKLLQFITSLFGNEGRCLREYSSATSMCINNIKAGIINENVVKSASAAEITMRHTYHMLTNGAASKEVMNIKPLIQGIMDGSALAVSM